MKLNSTIYLTAALIAATAIPSIAHAELSPQGDTRPIVSFPDSHAAQDIERVAQNTYTLTAVKFSTDLKDVNAVGNEHLEILHYSNALPVAELYN